MRTVPPPSPACEKSIVPKPSAAKQSLAMARTSEGSVTPCSFAAALISACAALAAASRITPRMPRPSGSRSVFWSQ